MKGPRCTCVPYYIVSPPCEIDCAFIGLIRLEVRMWLIEGRAIRTASQRFSCARMSALSGQRLDRDRFRWGLGLEQVGGLQLCWMEGGLVAPIIWDDSFARDAYRLDACGLALERQEAQRLMSWVILNSEEGSSSLWTGIDRSCEDINLWARLGIFFSFSKSD